MLVTHLLCREIVLRAILKKGWLDEQGNITATAFVRDSRRDPDGLSVNIRSLTNTEAWLSTFKKSFGADTLHSGRVRDLSLEIGQTETDIHEGNGHALIVGIPDQDDDPKRAEDLASDLQKISRPLDRTPRKGTL